MARVDSLFVLETVLAAWLSVSIASRARPLQPALAFGVLMGATMLTRQAVSYPLWLLPPIAALCARRRDWQRLLLPLGLSFTIALLLWTPMLVVEAPSELSDRIFHVGATRPPLTVEDRAVFFIRNLETCVAAFWTYLTPPVFLLSLTGIAILATTRLQLFAFLAAWGFLLLFPAALFAVSYFPRYALPAALPLLAAAGFAIAFAWMRTARWTRVALVIAVLAWPLLYVLQGIHDWKDWPLLPVDRRQFVSGWSAGSAAEKAASFLEVRGREHPIAVIVPQVSGNPSDSVWLLLEKSRRIRLFYAADFPRLPVLTPASGPGSFLLRGDIWTGATAAPVRLEPERPIFFVCPDPVFVGLLGWAPAAAVVAERNIAARLVARFENPPNRRGVVESAVIVYRLR
jgi:hypothetical protein